MKKLIMIALGVFVSLTLLAQQPMRPQGPRVLPNQFRDFVDHQQMMEMGRPQIELSQCLRCNSKECNK
jgi:hypothetical protein